MYQHMLPVRLVHKGFFSLHFNCVYLGRYQPCNCPYISQLTKRQLIWLLYYMIDLPILLWMTISYFFFSSLTKFVYIPISFSAINISSQLVDFSYMSQQQSGKSISFKGFNGVHHLDSLYLHLVFPICSYSWLMEISDRCLYMMLFL